jgi:nitrite reductase/ring-hydroxylating ferredoxin subunit
MSELNEKCYFKEINNRCFGYYVSPLLYAEQNEFCGGHYDACPFKLWTISSNPVQRDQKTGCPFKDNGFKDCIGKHTSPELFEQLAEFCGGNYDACPFQSR